MKNEIELARKNIASQFMGMRIFNLKLSYMGNEIHLRTTDNLQHYWWDQNKKTGFIESILLGLPTGDFIFSKQERFNLEIIDGQQRLLTIMEFIGVLNNGLGGYEKPLILNGGEILPFLQGMSWEKLTDWQRDLFAHEVVKCVYINGKCGQQNKNSIFDRLNTI